METTYYFIPTNITTTNETFAMIWMIVVSLIMFGRLLYIAFIGIEYSNEEKAKKEAKEELYQAKLLYYKNGGKGVKPE